MIGGAAWLFNKERKRQEEAAVQVMESYGYREALSTFLCRYHPGLQIFQAYGANELEVVMPAAPRRKEIEQACDEAWERTNDR